MESALDVLDQFILSHQALILASTCLLTITGLIVFHIAAVRLNRLRRLYRSALDMKDLDDLEKIIAWHRQAEQDLERRVAVLEEAMAEARIESRAFLRHCVLERYRAFRDIGGDQSFSLALLDGQANGIILTSIYGRDESRVFAKSIKEGESTHPLSDEERHVLAAARSESGKNKKEKRG